MAQNVKFIKGDTAKINGTAITDGQLLYNTTTGQHYIDNESTRVEVGKPEKPVVNTMAEVSAITEDNIPCGTKPVKELNDKISTWVDISSLISKNTFVSVCDGLYNPATKEVKITIFTDATQLPDGVILLGLPLAYRPSTPSLTFSGAMAKKDILLSVSDYNPALITVNTNGNITANFYTGSDMRYLMGVFSYILR